MNTFHLVVSTPDGNKFDGQATGLFLRGSDGDLAVLAGHSDFITSVKPGKCRIKVEDEEKIGRVDGGLLTVGKNVTTLISSSFIWE